MEESNRRKYEDLPLLEKDIRRAVKLRQIDKARKLAHEAYSIYFEEYLKVCEESRIYFSSILETKSLKGYPKCLSPFELQEFIEFKKEAASHHKYKEFLVRKLEKIYHEQITLAEILNGLN